MKPGSKFVGCSDKVAAALGPDVMKTVKPLIPDLLAALPVLLYQGRSRAVQVTLYRRMRLHYHYQVGVVNTAKRFTIYPKLGSLDSTLRCWQKTVMCANGNCTHLGRRQFTTWTVLSM